MAFSPKIPGAAATSHLPPQPPPPPQPAISSGRKHQLPLRKIPGDGGLPFIGAYLDRLSFFYGAGGREEFLRSRIRRHNSTVLRLNVPPGPFLATHHRPVIALLDAASFPVLFDNNLVDKRDVFTGTFTPSHALTGGHRVMAYLDPSEPNHGLIKKLIFFLLASRRHAVIPEFSAVFSDLFAGLETQIAAGKGVEFGLPNEAACFSFLSRALLGRDVPATLGGAAAAAKLLDKWFFFQLAPIVKLGGGLPSFVEDLLFHTFRLPAALVRRDYDRLAGFFRDAFPPELTEEAIRLGVPMDEAVHNLLFAFCFNAYGGMKLLFPTILKWVGRGGAELHRRLAEEVRGAAAASSGGGEEVVVTMGALEAMPLVKSVVFEVLRIGPPVPMQYGRAKKDMVVESHDGAYEVSAGELLFGYQPFATRDPKVFGDTAEEFVPERFIGEEGEKLLKYVVWSNGPETASPAPENKQCAGKDFVVLVARLLVAEIFLRYDSFDVEVGESPLGPAVTITALRRRHRTAVTLS